LSLIAQSTKETPLAHLPFSLVDRKVIIQYGLAACFLLTRLAFALLTFVASVYCLLLYIPFSYFGFIHAPVLWWLPGFVHLYPRLLAVAFCAVVITLVPAFRIRATRFSALAFLLTSFGMCFYLSYITPFSGFLPDFVSYLWSIANLFPLVWLGVIDFATAHSRRENAISNDLRVGNLKSSAIAAILAAVVFAIASAVHQLLGSSQPISGRMRLLGAGWSIAAHITIFVIIGSLLYLTQRVALRLPHPGRVYLVISRSFGWILCAAAILKIALPSLSFFGTRALAVSLSFSLAFVVSLLGSIARIKAMLPKPGPGLGKNAWTRLLIILFFLLLAFAIPMAFAKSDWDFVVEKLLVLLSWVCIFIFARRIDVFQRSQKSWAASAVALLIACLTLAGFYKLNSAEDGSSWSNVIDVYAGTDISFKTASDILARAVARDDHDAFYKFLQAHTNLGQNVHVAPANVDLVPQLSASPAKKPNIFIFVIDSLRQDYLAPYNPAAAAYAPAMARFAQDSIVFQKAFTRYAGTALSEPAIWVGAMQAHKQFIQPFASMNNLEKLVETDGYESFVSDDTILQIICSPSFPDHKLNSGLKMWDELDMIPTLKEIEQGIAARTDTRKPIFVYSQPQNVHTVTLELQKHGTTRREMSIYELRRIDNAFGEFIGFLKNRNLYDNSIIIITSDHGDSYGEFGRYGHSDFLFPEVIRIPLIIHVPQTVQKNMVYDPAQVAFSVDITPTLYYLLGHGPLKGGELFGRSLFTDTATEQQFYLHHKYLLVSSYAPVYGILGDNGASLFIADAVNRRSYFYDFAQDPEETQNHITPRRNDEEEKEVRRQVGLLDQLYHMDLKNLPAQ
jgi:hypothetical protein